jgi:hypothetical protein
MMTAIINLFFPPTTTSLEAEQWLFRHDEYLTEHKKWDFDAHGYLKANYPCLPRQAPEQQRKSIIKIFQADLVERWLEDSTSSLKIKITEVLPTLKDKGIRDQYDLAKDWLAKKAEKEQKALEASDGAVLVEDLTQEEPPVTATTTTTTALYPKMEQASTGASDPSPSQYVPALAYKDIEEIGLKSKSYFSWGYGAPKLPKVDTKTLEESFEKAIVQGDVSDAVEAYVEGIQNTISNLDLKQKIAFFEQAIAKVKKPSRSDGAEKELREQFADVIIADAGRALAEALDDTALNAAAGINKFLEIKNDLIKLRKTPFKEPPEKLLVRCAGFTRLGQFQTPLGALHDAYAQAKSDKFKEHYLDSFRNRWSQWAWALQALDIVPNLPKDFYKSPEPVSIAGYSEPVEAQKPPEPIEPIETLLLPPETESVVSTPISAITIITPISPVREVSIPRPPAMKSYIDARFLDVVDGGDLKKQPYGIRYRLLKIALEENGGSNLSNDLAEALCEHERSHNGSFRASDEIAQMKENCLNPLLESYKDSEVIKAVYQVVVAIENKKSEEALSDAIHNVPERFFEISAFKKYLERQERYERKAGKNPLTTAQAMLAWFDSRLSAYAKFAKLS